jgi:hypothetical protein
MVKKLIGSAAVIFIALLAGCGVFDAGGIFEKVIAIAIDPAHPGPGDTVQAEADYTSNVFYPAMAGAGPKFTWRVSSGELTGLAYNYDLGDYVERHGTEIVTDLAMVQWTLPQQAGPVWISAEMDDGGKKLTLLLEPISP